VGRRTRVETYDAVVLCTGPALSGAEAVRPLVQMLLDSGQAIADPAGLGIVTDELGHVVAADGHASDRIFTLGALRRASSWESTTAPDISVQAVAIARAIVRR
jgi:uncharacterized NAD(P)/FAD-binding protein YdhS